jgi:antitoxin (DNA-binding transcriptional repressor) of toxin-antitoxin stability system
MSLDLLRSDEAKAIAIFRSIRFSMTDAGAARFEAALAPVATGGYYVAMRAVGIKLLKNRLSEYVRLAAAGETVLVTDRDRVVAQLGPPEAARGSSVADTLLADAVREGLVTPASLPPGPPPEVGPVAPLEEILKELAADREDR